MRMKPGRNDPCSCGSGKKYKNCCLGKAVFDPPRPSAPSSDEISQLDALFNAGRYAEMENRARSLLKLYPDSGITWKQLSVSLHMQGKDPLPALQKAAELLPNDAEAHGNLALVLRARGQLEAAVASGRRALLIRPGFAEAYNNLGVALKDLGRLDEAVASYRRALEIKPGFAEAYNNLGKALSELGQFDSAVASYRRALEIRPGFAEAHNNLGNALNDLGQLEAALACFRRAIELKPGIAEAHNNLGVILEKIGQLYDAVASYRKAVEIKPDYAEAYRNLGVLLQTLGQSEAALASYRKALEIKPDYALAYSNLLFLQGYHALTDPDEYLALARNWELACVPENDRQLAHNRIFRRLPLPGRRLKVGYVSGDYRRHAVSYFIEQLFIHHDRSQIELFAYSTNGHRDAVTERLQAIAEHWIPLVGLSDSEARNQIESDGIDVLIDLCGHTGHNRLGVFARRAAPVQAYYLGYFASTGLTEMDYWIGDNILTPPELDNHFSEQVWRLPRTSWSYDGKDAPSPAWQPDPNGSVWIGSFNNLEKLTPSTLALWARVLHALPEGKLLLKDKQLSNIGNRQRILNSLSSHGILQDRVELRDSSSTPDWSAHMAYYDRLDIALDPVGAMGGVTTTCDALWMAVPIIAMQGDRVASRATAAMLTALGHPDWIARSEAEYADKVVALARDKEQRKMLRQSQRSLMASSPLCDARGLAMSLEKAYSDMFERWLEVNISKNRTAK
jgi:protein O-GlcNAc transferase